MADVIVEIIPPDALIVDGLEDQNILLEALNKSRHYDSLALRDKIKYWEDSGHVPGAQPLAPYWTLPISKS